MAVSLGPACPAKAASFDDNLHLSVLPESTPQRLLLDFRNANPSNPASDSRRPFYRYLVVGSLQKPAVNVLDYQVHVFFGEERQGPYDRQELERAFGAIPSSEFFLYAPQGVFRLYKLARIQLRPCFPMRWPQTGQARIVVDSFRAELAFGDAKEAGEASAGKTPMDPLLERVVEPLVVNPPSQIKALARLERPSSDFAEALAWKRFLEKAAASGPIARIEVSGSGLFALSAGQLRSAGIDPSRFKSDSMRLFCDNIEIPLHVVRKERASDWSALFVSKPFPPHEPHTRSYILITDQGRDARAAPPANPHAEGGPKRLPVAPAPPATASSAALTTGTARVALAPRLLYYHRIQPTKDFSHWYWLEMGQNEFRNIDVDLPDLDPRGPDPQLTLFLPSAEPGTGTQCCIYWNGTLVGTARWTSAEHKIHTQPVPVSLCRPGTNQLTLEYSVEGLDTPAQTLYLSRCEVAYARFLRAGQGPLEVSLPAALGSRRTVALEGFAEKPIVAAWSDPLRPRLFEPRLENGPERRWRFTADLSEDIHLEIVEPSDVRRPSRIEPVKPPNLWTASRGVETLVIAPQSLLPAIEPWLAFRAESGGPIRAVSVEDIYLAFNYANPHPQAIRQFLRYAYYNWGSPLLATVLLVGESSDLEGPPEDTAPEASPDQLPVFYVSRPAPEPRGDNEYCEMNDTDRLPDLAIGRIPARSADEFTSVCLKIRAYEEDPKPGFWRSRNLFIADDEPVFAEVAERLKAECFPGSFQTVDIYEADYPYEDLFRMKFRKLAPQARKDIIRQLNEGVLTTTFFGHGGPNVWSHELLFHLDDLSRLQNKEAPTFVVVASCDTAWLDYPLDPAKASLGERFVTLSNGGAIGVFAPTGGASPLEHEGLFRALFNGLFRRGITRLGDTVLYAKLCNVLETSSDRLANQFVLVGDPLTSLRLPPRTLAVSVSPAEAPAHVQSTARITGRWPAGLNGKAAISLRLQGVKNRVLAQDVPVRNGRLDFTWNVPDDLPLGTHSIAVYAADENDQAETLGAASFEVAAEDCRIVLGPDLLSGRPRQRGETVPVSFAVENRRQAQAPCLNILVRSSGAEQPLYECQADLAPGESKRFRFNLEMQEGLRVLDFYLFPANSGPEDAAQWQRTRIVFPVLSEQAEETRIASDDALIEIRPSDIPPDTPLEVQVPIWNLGKAPSPRLLCQIVDKENIPFDQPVELNEPLQPGEKKALQFRIRTGLGPGEHQVRLTVSELGAAGPKPDPLLCVQRDLDVEPQTDLTFVPGSLRFESRDFIDGQTIYIHAVVRNDGHGQSPPAIVEAFQGTLQLEKDKLLPAYQTGPIKTPSLKPGQSCPLTLRWDSSHSAGLRPVQVWVNRDRAVVESNMDNNCIEGQVRILPPTNFFIRHGELRAQPSVARLGQTVVLTAGIASDRPQNFSEIPTAFYAGNGRSGLKQVGQTFCGPPGPPTLGYEFRREVSVSPEAHRFAIEVNIDHPVSESMVSDNRAETSVDLLLSLESLRHGNEYDLMAAVDAGRLIGLRQTPRGDLTCGDMSQYPTTHYEITPDCVRGDFVASPSLSLPTDGKWWVGDKRLESGPKEDTPPIAVSLPFPETPALAYDVSLWVETNASYLGASASRLRLRWPGQQTWRDFDFSKDVMPWTTLRYSVGRAPKDGQRFEFLLDDAPEGAWTVLRGVDLTPLTGTYLSPFIDLGNEARGRLRFHAREERGPDSRAACFCRFGSLANGADPQWGAWQAFELDAEGRSPELPIAGPLLQWRVCLMAGIQSVPRVADMGFELTEDQ